MKLYGALILLVTVSAAFGLKCYQCSGKSCTDTVTCPDNLDRCSSTELNGVVLKACINNMVCVSPMKCCKEDLCNGAIPTGSSVLLLLVSSAIMTVFL